MPNFLQAPILVLLVAALCFALARPAVLEMGVTPEDYRRRRNLWIAATLISFWSFNFWIYFLVTSIVFYKAGKSDPHPMAAYATVLFAIAPYEMAIPLPGGLNMLFELSPFRALSLAILIPLSLHLYKNRLPRTPAIKAIDFLVGSLCLLAFVATALHLESVTAIGRTALYIFLDIVLPYYAASRALTTLSSFRNFAVAFFVPLTILGLLAVHESVRHWNVYDIVGETLDYVKPSVGSPYLQRGEGGPVRARVTSGQPIVLGYLMMIALMLLAFLRPRIKSTRSFYFIGACLALGSLAAISRGPWVGTAAAAALFVCMGPGTGKRVMSLIGGTGLAVVVILLSPLGDTFIAYLPFVGSVESNNIDYRTKLFEVSMEVLRQNFWFGDVLYLQHPLMEQMRQGQGIIDVVNTYLGYAMPYGFVGVFCFVMPFVIAMLAVWKRQRAVLHSSPEAERLGRMLIATVVGVLVTLATVSSIGAISTVYWLLLGLCCSYIRAVPAERVLKPAKAATSKAPIRSSWQTFIDEKPITKVPHQ